MPKMLHWGGQYTDGMVLPRLLAVYICVMFDALSHKHLSQHLDRDACCIAGFSLCGNAGSFAR
jgi:hypothetical protein